MFGGLRRDVQRAQIKQEHRRDKKFAAHVLGVKTRDIGAAIPTENGQGLAVYYTPRIDGRTAELLVRVGYDGAVYGEPVEFPTSTAAVEHMADGRWREV